MILIAADLAVVLIQVLAVAIGVWAAADLGERVLNRLQRRRSS